MRRGALEATSHARPGCAAKALRARDDELGGSEQLVARGRAPAETAPSEPAVPPRRGAVPPSGPLPARAQGELRSQGPAREDSPASPEQLYVVVARTRYGRQAKDRRAGRTGHIAAVVQGHDLRQSEA